MGRYRPAGPDIERYSYPGVDSRDARVVKGSINFGRFSEDDFPEIFVNLRGTG